MPTDTALPSPYTTRDLLFDDGKSRKVAVWACDPEEKNSQVLEDFIRLLTGSGCSVRAMMYLTRPGFSPLKHKCDTYTRRDVALNGRIKKDFVKYFLDQEFDHIFVLSTTLPSSFKYLIKRCKAKYKIGPFLSGAEQLFDLSIGAAEEKFSLKQLTEATIHYTKRIYGNRN